jgi:hypothetical protein
MAAIGNSPTQQAFTPAIDYFSGNGSTTAFTLSRPVASVAQVQVTIDNVAQNPSSAYTVSSNTITFTSAPLSGTNNIYVYYTSPITQVIAPGQSTVGLTALSATGTPSASTYLRGDNSWAAVSVSPGGSTTQVQYNNAGAFAGSANLTFSGSALALTGSSTILKNGGTGATAGLLLSGGGSSTQFNIDYGTVASNRLYMRQNYTDNSGDVTFRYSSDGTMGSPTDVLAVKWGGGIAVTGLVDISAATSGQIKFPATANPSSNANTLDDYEEGTWTATDASGAGLGNLGSGYYTKIGNYVFLAVYCTWPTTSNGADNLIGGVPFAAVNTYYQGAVQSSGGGSPIISRMSGSTIRIYAAGNTQPSNAALSGAFVLISFGYLMS